MSVLQTVALAVVLVTGTGVVTITDPLRQTLMLGVFGLALTLLFFVYQAPDVALSEIVIGALALPVIVLAALRKLNEQERAKQDREP
jgi:energy-converting hydrogenase B subunit D